MKQICNQEKYHRRSIRLPGFNYSQAGAYFITICIKDRQCLFGNAVEGKVELSQKGEIAYEFWLKIPAHFKNVQLDEFIVMPNHIHGIIIINMVGAEYIQPPPYLEPLQINKFQHLIPKSLGSIFRSYKAAVTRQCNKNGNECFPWQRNYYEHIIRNENELALVREYIVNNPLQWQFDRENPEYIVGVQYIEPLHKTKFGYLEEAIYGKTK